MSEFYWLVPLNDNSESGEFRFAHVTVTKELIDRCHRLMRFAERARDLAPNGEECNYVALDVSIDVKWAAGDYDKNAPDPDNDEESNDSDEDDERTWDANLTEVMADEPWTIREWSDDGPAHTFTVVEELTDETWEWDDDVSSAKLWVSATSINIVRWLENGAMADLTEEIDRHLLDSWTKFLEKGAQS